MRTVLLLAVTAGCAAQADNEEAVAQARRTFVDRMVKEHGFDRAALTDQLEAAAIDQRILDAMSRPAERVVPWYEYRNIFITDKRIAAGVDFWKEHAEALGRIAAQYEVAPEIVVGIIGVETFFGQITGRHRVIDALSTLAFAYPPRAKFFSSELESFLLLTREEGVDVFEPLGFVRGRHGRGQFIPSSYRAYAVDANADGRRDIWNDLGRRDRQRRELLQEARLGGRATRGRAGHAARELVRPRAREQAGARRHDRRADPRWATRSRRICRPVRRQPCSRSRPKAAGRSFGSVTTTSTSSRAITAARNTRSRRISSPKPFASGIWRRSGATPSDAAQHALHARLLRAAHFDRPCRLRWFRAANRAWSSVAPSAYSPPPRRDRGNPPFYDVLGKRYYVLESSEGYQAKGVASWYGGDFHGLSTSSGERYDMHAMTAAHTTLPIPTWVEVTNLGNGKRVIVKVNDRGPFVDSRLIDLSYAAATALDMIRAGTARVEVRAIGEPPSPAKTTAAAPAPPAPPANVGGAHRPARNNRGVTERANVPAGRCVLAACERDDARRSIAREWFCELVRRQRGRRSENIAPREGGAAAGRGRVRPPERSVAKPRCDGFTPGRRSLDCSLVRGRPAVMLRSGLLLTALFVGAVQAQERSVPEPPKLVTKSYYLVDFASDRVLAQSAADQRVEPASLTKLMTAYAVFKALDDGRISLDDEAPVSVKAWRTGGTRMFIDVNSRVRVEDLIRGMLIQSGNDASVALAEHISGSVEAFVDSMNAYAAELGMSNTAYRNPTGLPARNHYSSARDMAILAKAVIAEFPDHYQMYAEREFSYNNILQYNRNRLLWRDPSVDGLKTGHTEAAGYCIVTSALRDDMRLIAVVLGATTSNARTAAAQKLLDYGFEHYETHKLYSAGQEISVARVWGGEPADAPLGLAHDLFVTIPRGLYPSLTASMSVPVELVAPLQTGAAVGEVNVRLDGAAVVERAARDAAAGGGRRSLGEASRRARRLARVIAVFRTRRVALTFLCDSPRTGAHSRRGGMGRTTTGRRALALYLAAWALATAYLALKRADWVFPILSLLVFGGLLSSLGWWTTRRADAPAVAVAAPGRQVVWFLAYVLLYAFVLVGWGLGALRAAIAPGQAQEIAVLAYKLVTHVAIPAALILGLGGALRDTFGTGHGRRGFWPTLAVFTALMFSLLAIVSPSLRIWRTPAWPLGRSRRGCSPRRCGFRSKPDFARNIFSLRLQSGWLQSPVAAIAPTCRGVRAGALARPLSPGGPGVDGWSTYPAAGCRLHDRDVVAIVGDGGHPLGAHAQPDAGRADPRRDRRVAQRRRNGQDLGLVAALLCTGGRVDHASSLARGSAT